MNNTLLSAYHSYFTHTQAHKYTGTHARSAWCLRCQSKLKRTGTSNQMQLKCSRELGHHFVINTQKRCVCVCNKCAYNMIHFHGLNNNLNYILLSTVRGEIMKETNIERVSTRIEKRYSLTVKWAKYYSFFLCSD